jgi:hypothetical protein
MERPCDYCGTDLPHGVDLRTRRIRSAHFQSCAAQHRRREPINAPQSADRDALDAAISALELDADWRVRQEAASGLREMRERIA